MQPRVNMSLQDLQLEMEEVVEIRQVEKYQIKVEKHYKLKEKQLYLQLVQALLVEDRH